MKEYGPHAHRRKTVLDRRFLDEKLLLSPGKSYMCKEPAGSASPPRIRISKPLRLKAGRGLSRALVGQP